MRAHDYEINTERLLLRPMTIAGKWDMQQKLQKR